MKKTLKLIQTLKESQILIVVFALCFIYWGYLFFASQMEIRHDAIAYEKLGLMLYQDGWKEFFKTGPHREPLYPFLISCSMRIADTFSISYFWVQKFIQIILLFMTQILVLALLGILRIYKTIKALIILYIGFSPALVNAAFSLYSEIVACPAVVMLIITAFYSWRAIHTQDMYKTAFWSVLMAVVFILVSSVKAIFQYIYLIFLIPHIVIFIRSFKRKYTRIFRNAAVFIVVSFLVFATFAIFYRALNKKYNGKFDFTNRYDFQLFGNAGVRTEKLSTEIFMARVASVPGAGFCRKFFSEEACLTGEFHHSDDYWYEHLMPFL